MQNTTSAYKEQVKALPQNYKMEIEAVFDADTIFTLDCESGTVLESERSEVLELERDGITVPPGDIFEAGFAEQIFLNTFTVGSTVSPTFWVRIFNKDGQYSENELAKAEIHPYVTLYDANGAVTDKIPVGVFFTEKLIAQNIDMRMECIDKMRYCERLYVPQNTKRTLLEIALSIAQDVRGTLVNTVREFPLLNKIVEDSIFKGYNKRQVLAIIAEALGSFAIFNPEGNLEFKWFRETDIELRGDWANAALELNGNTFSLDGNAVQVTGVRIVSEDTELAKAGTDDYLLTINENPVAALFPLEVADFVIQRLAQTRYIPCKWTRIGGDPSLQVGDIVTVIDNKEAYNEAHSASYAKYPLYMTSRSWTFNGSFSDKYCADGNAEQDLNTDKGMTQSKRTAQLAKRITETRKDLTADMDEREKSLLLFNEAIAGSMGLYQTIVQGADGARISYMHDKPQLEDSKIIYTFGENGFAWTDSGWQGNETLWQYGFDKNGNAILNALYAYKISADVIESGLLKSKNGASCISMDDGTFQFRRVSGVTVDVDTGKTKYEYENKLILDAKGRLTMNGNIVNDNGLNIIRQLKGDNGKTSVLELGNMTDVTLTYVSADEIVWLFANEVHANATTIATTSDARLKRDITDILADERYISFFDNLKPALFKYTEGKSGRTHMGLIAQQVAEAANAAGLDVNDMAAYVEGRSLKSHEQLCGKSELSLRYDEFVGLLIAKVQSLNKKVAQQEERLCALEKALAKLTEI